MKFNIEMYRQLEARAEQLNSATRLAGERYREASLDVRQREERLRKETPTHLASRSPQSDEQIREVAALQRDVEVGRSRFGQLDRERVESQARWNTAAALFKNCQDFLLAHGIANPDASHDQHSVSFVRRVGR